MKRFIRIGIDLAKNYFQVHALASEGGPAITRKLKRSKMRGFFSQFAENSPSVDGAAAERWRPRRASSIDVGAFPSPPEHLEFSWRSGLDSRCR
jgi:transposase